MKKRFLLMFFLLVLGVGARSQSYDFKSDDLYYSIISNTSTVKVVKGNYSDLKSISIPKTVSYESVVYSVTTIDYYAFEGCSNLTSIVIPESIKKIGAAAFSGCTSLKSIVIPESVEGIGNSKYGSTFFDCKNLESVTFNGSILEELDAGIFTGCNSLKTITFNSLVPPKVEDDLLTDNIVNDAKLYISVTIDFPKDAKLYRTMQPWCNFNFADGLSDGHRVDTIYIIDTVYVGNQIENKYNVRATTADAAMGIAIGTGRYEKGEMAEITAIANYGYHFTRWSDGNTDNPRYPKVVDNCEFKAEFEVNNYNVMAAANENKMGNVTGAAEYAYLSRTTLKAMPNKGYKFAGWSDGETANPREVLVYSDTLFVAVFEQEKDGHKPIVPVTDPVSAIINQINSVFNMIYDLTTDVEEEAVNEVNIYAYGNSIVVENADAEIFVYDAMGRLVCRSDEKLVRTELQLNGTGIYVVKVGNEAKRVMIN